MTRSRLLLVVTIGIAFLYLAATVALGTPPEAKDSGTEVVAWFRDHDGNVRAWLWLLTLSLPLFATFAALVRHRLPGPHRDIFFFGALVLVVETGVQGWLWAGLAWHADDVAPATARTVLDVASFWGPVLTGATVTMIAPVTLLVLRGDQLRLPRWLGILGAVVVAEQLLETVTIFGDTGFTAPGGPMNALLGALLFAVWLVCLGVAVSREDAPALNA